MESPDDHPECSADVENGQHGEKIITWTLHCLWHDISRRFASWKMKTAALLFRKELRHLREIERYYHGFA
jgi:hypothetical protein